MPNPAADRSGAVVRAPQPPDTAPHAERRGWIVAAVLGALLVAGVRVASGLPDVLGDIGAVLVTISLSWALAVRTGGRALWSAAIATVLGVAAVSADWHPLQAGAAIGTGVVAAVLAVMITTPAATFVRAIKEMVIATAVGWIGAFGVVGYVPGDHRDLNVDRFGYVVLALALAGAIALVYRLGAGLHGLGRRGYVIAGGAVIMLFLALAYSEAIAHWGSRDIVSTGDDVRASVRHHLGAVPHPIVAVLGYPALLWGVFMRARRRQGWWVCAFGVAATASTASRLVAPDTGFANVALGTLYSAVIGIVIGYLVVRIEQSFSGTHGRRARRDEEAEAHRPEPRRTAPLH